MVTKMTSPTCRYVSCSAILRGLHGLDDDFVHPAGSILVEGERIRTTGGTGGWALMACFTAFAR